VHTPPLGFGDVTHPLLHPLPPPPRRKVSCIMIDRWDTGYRSPDWDSRADWEKRLDYHDMGVNVLATDLVNRIRRMCRDVADENPGHDFDYTRNILALMLRQVGWAFGMNPERLRSFVHGLADQAYREERVREFHCEARKGPRNDAQKCLGSHDQVL
jgi:hypothetical protein